jgi:hypothetical protein
MRSTVLEYMSDLTCELANLAEMNNYPSLVRLLRAAAAEAEHLEKASHLPDGLVPAERKQIKLSK